MPDAQKPVPEGAEVIPLPKPDPELFPDEPIWKVIDERRSIRRFRPEPIGLGELAWLLWATQGVQRLLRDGTVTLRTVPSAGARHPFETYLFVNDVSELAPGLYRYLPLEHALVRLGERVPPEDVAAACHGQAFAGECAVCFAWSAVPYRTEWRYGPVSHKVIALDAGHLCQNLYLACSASGMGTCAIGAYDQDAMDDLLGLDGDDEMVVYVAPVGRV